jgi:hypothetical protein
MTATVEQTIAVQVPIETACNQWSSSRSSRASWRGSRKSGNWMIAGFAGPPSSGGERHVAVQVREG